MHIRPEIERKLNLGTRTFPEVCTVEAATISPSVQIEGEKESKTRKTRSISKAVEKQPYRFPRLNIDATPAHSAYFDSKGTLSHQDKTFFSPPFSIPNLQYVVAGAAVWLKGKLGAKEQNRQLSEPTQEEATGCQTHADLRDRNPSSRHDLRKPTAVTGRPGEQEQQKKDDYLRKKNRIGSGY